MKEIEIHFIKATDCCPAADADFFQVSCYDSEGIGWYANESFATAADAAAFIISFPSLESGWYCAGPSYALGQVDEALLMDDEERHHKGM
jgi:hypothetical protein